jgi:hypothetical protein
MGCRLLLNLREACCPPTEDEEDSAASNAARLRALAISADLDLARTTAPWSVRVGGLMQRFLGRSGTAVSRPTPAKLAKPYRGTQVSLQVGAPTGAVIPWRWDERKDVQDDSPDDSSENLRN